MKKIIIIGAGGQGKETAWLAKRCGREVLGFLDDTPEKQNIKILGSNVLGPIHLVEKYQDCEFVIAIGNPRFRKKIFEYYFKGKNFNFATLIDPTAIIGEQVDIMAGSIIGVGVVLTVNIVVGKHVIINNNSTISHDVNIRDFVTIAPNATIPGNVTLYELVEVGANATVREKLTIQSGALIGMGAVLTKNVDKNNVMVGNPAKFLKNIES